MIGGVVAATTVPITVMVKGSRKPIRPEASNGFAKMKDYQRLRMFVTCGGKAKVYECVPPTWVDSIINGHCFVK